MLSVLIIEGFLQRRSLPMTDFTELDDEALAARIIEDSSAFSILYDRYFPAVYRYIDFYRTNKDNLHVDMDDLFPDSTLSMDQMEDMKHIANLITQLDEDAQ